MAAAFLFLVLVETGRRPGSPNPVVLPVTFSGLLSRRCVLELALVYNGRGATRLRLSR